jgi:hypothetical protein
MSTAVNADIPVAGGSWIRGGSKTPKIGHFGLVKGPRGPLLPRNGHFGCVFAHPWQTRKDRARPGVAVSIIIYILKIMIILTSHV